MFGGSFWKGIFPFLWIGGTGTGIKLYMKDGSLLDTDLLVFSNDSNTNTVSPAQVTIPDTGKDTQTTSQPPVSIPAYESYGDALEKMHLTLIKETTSYDVMKNTLIQRMYPHYAKQVDYSPNRLFTGNQKIIMPGKEYTTTDGMTLFVLDQPTQTETDKLKQDCIKELPKKNEVKEQLQKLKEWCTEPTVKAVLERHKFRFLDTSSDKDDTHWKEIISGGWFSETYKNQQTFIDSSDLDNFSGINSPSDVTETHINILKNKCKDAITKAYVKNYFPATKDFISKLNEKDKQRFTGIDTFQQVAQFCTEPKTAEKYAQTGMHGKGRSVIEERQKKDYCYISSKDITDYKNVKTFEPFAGKGFWCAVRIVYERK